MERDSDGLRGWNEHLAGNVDTNRGFSVPCDITKGSFNTCQHTLSKKWSMQKGEWLAFSHLGADCLTKENNMLHLCPSKSKERLSDFFCETTLALLQSRSVLS